MKEQNIRIRLKAYDHRVLDTSAKEILERAIYASRPPIPEKLPVWFQPGS